MIGTVVKWFEENSFGFAKPDALAFDVFVHSDFLVDQSEKARLGVGQRIAFDLAPAVRKGLKPRAARVAVVGAASFEEQRSRSKAARLKG
ncbi:cold shock domain-containing protein [Bradyrhizobium diazoefficiens]|uniref:cold shock domain-containing protein n=1 Tax=Bradyrhizobium diazoefficiens TaxID=1355477 RepID=UPI00190A4C9A|nr:cold shock domain-containing protein [Bradyrhizobium diazoefficiens]QQO14960.1 cold shock domain-containing protein [Bradyrhizobium diazoefficiens]